MSLRPHNSTPADRMQKGFTLIEIMVALVILSVMTVLTAGAIQNAVRSREKMSGLISRESSVRDALRVIERDVNSAFHYRDENADMLAAIQAAASQPATASGTNAAGVATPPVAGATPTPTPNAAPAADAAKKRPQYTQFIGEKDRMDFSALSHVRVEQDSAESDQAEIGYYLAPCRSRKAKALESNCLWRRQALQIDDDVTKGGEASVLIENVTTFALRYLGPGKDEWQDTWKTDQNGDDVTKNTFPYAVEVTLKTQDKNDPNGKPTSMTMVAEIRFPNNASKKTDAKGNPILDGSGATTGVPNAAPQPGLTR